MSFYTEQHAFPEHIPLKKGPNYFKCGFRLCGFAGNRYIHYFDHVSEQHYCTRCALYCSRIQNHDCPRVNQFGGGDGPGPNNQFFDLISNTHDSVLLEYQHVFENPTSDLALVFNSIERPSIELIETLMETRDALVAKIILACVLSRDVILANGFTFKRYSRIFFPSENTDLYSGNDTRDFLIDAAAYIMNDIRSFLMNASGWVLEKCESVQFQCSTLQLFQSARIGSYLKFPFPGRRGVYNFKVKSQCVEWAITAGFFF